METQKNKFKLYLSVVLFVIGIIEILMLVIGNGMSEVMFSISSLLIFIIIFL